LTDSNEAAVTEEAQPVKTEKKKAPKVDPNALPVSVWVANADEALGQRPEIVRAALYLDGHETYNRDQVNNAVNKFMQRPVEQEG
jgi:hypothetical protein